MCFLQFSSLRVKIRCFCFSPSIKILFSSKHVSGESLTPEFVTSFVTGLNCLSHEITHLCLGIGQHVSGESLTPDLCLSQ